MIEIWKAIGLLALYVVALALTYWFGAAISRFVFLRSMCRRHGHEPGPLQGLWRRCLHCRAWIR